VNARARALRDALAQLRSALLDLSAAGRHQEASEVAAIVKRLEAGS
jgi:hypothetical protein